MPGEDRSMGDVLGDHGLPETVRAQKDQVATLFDEIERESSLDRLAVDLLGPVPVEVGDGLEAAEVGVLKTSLEPAPGALGEFGAGDLLDQGPSRPAALGGASDEVVEGRSGGMQSDLGELPREVTGRGRCE